MKTFKDYLSESTRKYDFRVKIAGEFDKQQESTMKELLGKFQLNGFKKVGTTPIQELPLDFPKIKNAQVSIYEVSLDYPSTQWELQEYICNNLKLTMDSIVVRKPDEPYEEYQKNNETKEDTLLTDSEYKEAPNANFEEFYGDKYNSGFVKELNDILKLQRKERGEVIPSEGPAKYSTDTPANGNSVFNKVAEDPRK